MLASFGLLLAGRLVKSLLLSVFAVIVLISSTNSIAQPYPTKPINLFVGFPAGGAADIVARLMGEKLSAKLGQPVVILNKPGAASTIGMVAAAGERAAARRHQPREEEPTEAERV